ncbi:MAG TPA: response regulator [Pyrinomonadaceae bacterium]|nr:response regulator [Pyrinomonadaceae bacterium]
MAPGYGPKGIHKSMEEKGRSRFSIPYMWLMGVLGMPIFLYAVVTVPFARFDWKFLLLAGITTVLGSRVGVEIPRIGGRITVADTLVFLTMLSYGGEAAVLLAAVETLLSSLRICRRPLLIFFNTGMMACSTFLTVQVVEAFFGPISTLHYGGANVYLLAVSLMALVQYIGNSGLVAAGAALKTDQPWWQTWKRYYLWTSMTYLAGASVAAVIARAADSVGILSIFATTPVIAIVYFTYRTYLKNVKTAEQQAEQARDHVAQLNTYIVQQERIREQFSQVEKMSALGQLASGVAHDFNNSLASILGRAELLMKHSDDPKMKRGLEIIAKSARDGAKTVKRIQDFARQRSERDFELVDVDQMLLDVSEITRPRWRDGAEARNVQINLDLRNHCGAYVNGDVSELRDVLVNVIFNAVHAMPMGGNLTLSSEVADGFVVLSVTDTGVGMPPEVRSRVFDPFFTTKGVEGMGLGLAVSYGVVSRHQGAFEVESELGKGSIFSIKLPIAAADSGADERAGVPGTTLRRSNMIRVLVVDDEDEVRNLLKEILEDAECEAVTASQGYDGLRLFEEGGFDAVFTDLGMPGMSGWELARAIRQRNQQIPLAIITGWGEAVSTSERDAAKVDWVLSKPFSMAQISEIVQEVCRRKGPAPKAKLTLVA